MRVYWTEEEFSKLRKYYEIDGMRSFEIAPLLNRTVASINIKIVRLKLRHTAEHAFNLRSKIRIGDKNPMFGKPAWSKGKTKLDTPSLQSTSEKMSKIMLKKSANGLLRDISGKNNPMYGKESWNKGENKFTNEKIKKYGEKCSIRKKKDFSNLSADEKEKLRLHCAKMSANQFSKKTRIEVIVENYLKSLDVEYIYNYPVGYYVADFYIPSQNLIIECQGDYWHANPIKYNKDNINKIQANAIRRDRAKKTYLTNKGYRLVYLWERDLCGRFRKVAGNIKREIVKNTKICKNRVSILDCFNLKDFSAISNVLRVGIINNIEIDQAIFNCLKHSTDFENFNSNIFRENLSECFNKNNFKTMNLLMEYPIIENKMKEVGIWLKPTMEAK